MFSGAGLCQHGHDQSPRPAAETQDGYWHRRRQRFPRRLIPTCLARDVNLPKYATGYSALTYRRAVATLIKDGALFPRGLSR
jgi:hypothetical protein